MLVIHVVECGDAEVLGHLQKCGYAVSKASTHYDWGQTYISALSRPRSTVVRCLAIDRKGVDGEVELLKRRRRAPGSRARASLGERQSRQDPLFAEAYLIGMPPELSS